MIPIYIGFTSLVQSRISHASRLFAQCRTNPVLVVCSGIPLCAWHSTGVPVWQSAADIRDCRSSMSPLCWHHDTTSAVDSSGYPWRPRLSGGCSACMEQSATRDSGLLLTFDIPEGDQVSPFSSVIWLMWRRLLRWSADVCIELCKFSVCNSSSQLSVPRHNLEFGSYAFRISAPNIWNLLPASIRNSPSIPTFRRHLKTHYFQSAYANP